MEMLLHFNTGIDKFYSEKLLRELLSGRYGNSVLISASMNYFGLFSSFRPVASKILKENWYDDRKQKRRWRKKKMIIGAAIHILQEEMRSQVYDCNLRGEMLIHPFSGLMKPVKSPPCKQKVLSVAHSIISSVRPRSAVQVRIGVFSHRRFRSRHLINLLHNLDWSISYSEICKYETSVTMNTSSEVQDNGFVQFVIDNADHNTRTMDGPIYVLDGVYLLRRLHLPSPATYSDVCNAYSDYVNRNNGTNIVEVFDGYLSTKDAVHM
ncbi:hypothetical protein AVEN_89263-1 [Araneus ventricosus]|uniref:Uncharacterized protein n=1 Tax=Araneus ventricosus TaxID=182803 RepID=A0A4Y2N8W7_ARAVE|nr:hypothetical protein AVEN_89263-1 [Araneus ventricosus]